MIENVTASCPYCGSTNDLSVDCSAGDQHYIEDCHTCCRPMEIILHVDGDGRLDDIEIRRDDQ